jgi:hypothetical protein
MNSVTHCNARFSPTGMTTNTSRRFVYGQKEKVRAVAVAKTNRLIRDKEINARAKRYIYGQKEADRLKAVIAANRFIATASAVTHLYDDDELGPNRNPDPTTMPWMFYMYVVLLITGLSCAYTYKWHCLSTGVKTISAYVVDVARPAYNQ